MKKNILFIIGSLCIGYAALGQSVTIDPGASSTKIIEAKSTTAGVLVPKMNSTQRNAIATSEEGLLVYDTDNKAFYFVQNGAWKSLSSTLALPFAGTYNSATTSALEVSNLQNAATANAGVFEAPYGNALQGITGTGIGGKFRSTEGTGIYAETFGAGYAGHFYGGNGSGLLIDRNGPVGNSLVIPRGKVGIGTTTPQNLFQVQGGINEYLWQTTAKETPATDDITVGIRVNQQYAGMPETAKVMFGTKTDHALNIITNDNTDSPDMTVYDGKVTIGAQISDSRLTVSKGTYGTAKFYGTNFGVSFMDGPNEDTYLAGGISTSKMFLNAVNGQTGTIHIGSATNAIHIGSLNEPLSKLTVTTPENALGLTHTDGTIRLGSYLGVRPNVTAPAGWMGTESNHPLHLYTNAGAPQLTIETNGKMGVGTTAPKEKLHVNGNMKADSGIYSAQLEGFNVVPMGVISYELNANDVGSGAASFTQYSTANLLGNLYNGTNSAYALLNTDDTVIGTLNLDAGALEGYLNIFIMVTYNVTQGATSGHSALNEIHHEFYRADDYSPNRIGIIYELDNLNEFNAKGTIMVYGIKGTATGPPIFGSSAPVQK